MRPHGSCPDEGLKQAELRQHLQAPTANKLAADPMPGITARLPDGDGNAPLAQADAQGEAGQAAADDRDWFHALLP